MNPPPLKQATASDVELALKELEITQNELLNSFMRLAQAYGGAVYPLDLLANAVGKRSMALIAGFCSLIRAKNFICAASLVRLHLDTLLRFAAAWMVDNPHEFASAVFDGTHIRKMKDKHGKLMTDQYLVSRLSVDEPWITRVYENTSGYIHLSRTHILSTHGPKEGTGNLSIVIGTEDEFIPEIRRLEACAAMIHITKLILWYVDGWCKTKDNPDLI
jgi:hypothetical protein